jgi:serine/threonine protein kinase
MLGRGTQGKVCKALNIKSGKFVAIKEMAIRDGPDTAKRMKVILNEIEIISNLNHPNIVQYHGCHPRDNFVYVVLEYIENGSLKDVVDKFGVFPESLAVRHNLLEFVTQTLNLV